MTKQLHGIESAGKTWNGCILIILRTHTKHICANHEVRLIFQKGYTSTTVTVDKRSQSVAKKAAGNHSQAAHQCERGEISKADVKCITSIPTLPAQFLCPVLCRTWSLPAKWRTEMFRRGNWDGQDWLKAGFGVLQSLKRWLQAGGHTEVKLSQWREV